jgi:hypothetical protein
VAVVHRERSGQDAQRRPKLASPEVVIGVW